MDIFKVVGYVALAPVAALLLLMFANSVGLCDAARVFNNF